MLEVVLAVLTLAGSAAINAGDLPPNDVGASQAASVAVVSERTGEVLYRTNKY